MRDVFYGRQRWLVDEGSHDAVARVAYLCSDVVVSVQPSLIVQSVFSPHFAHLVAASKHGIVASTLPEVCLMSRLAP